MSDFYVKMHQSRFLGELTAFPRPPSWIKGGLLLREGEGIWEGRGRGKGRGTHGRGWKGEGEEAKGREGKGRDGKEGHPQYFIAPPVPVF